MGPAAPTNRDLDRGGLGGERRALDRLPRRADRYGGTCTKLLAFWSDVQVYLLLGTDQLPSWGAEGATQYRCHPSSSPTVGSALLRIVLILPHAPLAWLLGIVVLAATLVAAVSVLVNESVPDQIWGVLMGVVAWQAGVLTYFFSMVEEYPPFSLEKGLRLAA